MQYTGRFSAIGRQSLRYSVTCSDSLSAVHSLLTVQIVCQLPHLYDRNCCVVFCWMPGRTGLTDNEAATDGISSCNWALWNDICASLYRAIYTCQNEWTTTQNNNLREVNPSVQAWISFFRPIRREGVVLTRLCIGHVRLTYGYLLRDEQMLTCAWCDPLLNVRHILTECPFYDNSHRIRDDNFSVNNVLSLALRRQCICTSFAAGLFTMGHIYLLQKLSVLLQHMLFWLMLS
jgi:hypothetical protein